MKGMNNIDYAAFLRLGHIWPTLTPRARAIARLVGWLFTWPYNTRLVQLLEHSMRRASEVTVRSLFIRRCFILFLLSFMFTPVNWIIGSIEYICQEENARLGIF